MKNWTTAAMATGTIGPRDVAVERLAVPCATSPAIKTQQHNAIPSRQAFRQRCMSLNGRRLKIPDHFGDWTASGLVAWRTSYSGSDCETARSWLPPIRPTNGCELIFAGLMGAEVVRQRRIGAGSSACFRSVMILSIGGKDIVDALLVRILYPGQIIPDGIKV
jgi:hypothetical protein